MNEIKEYVDNFGEKHSFKILYDKLIDLYFDNPDECISIKWKTLAEKERNMLEELAALHQIETGGGDGHMTYLYCKKCNIWHRTWNLID
jgi:hypothetical protein